MADGAPRDPSTETASLITLMKSNNPDLQHNALKGLMFCSTSNVVDTFLADDHLQLLVSLSQSTNKRVEAASLRLLWHLSAQAELKVKLYEEGVLDRLMTLMQNDDAEIQLACSAILQNISEYRFEKGAMNPNQVKIINGGILDRLASRINSTDRRIQFLACLTLCNLSMNEENARKIRKSGLLQGVREFVERSQLQIDMVCHWITLQPHIPLLRSIHPEVRLFGLSCLLTLSRNEQYKVEVWKALSMNDGVQTLFHLSRDADLVAAPLASLVIEALHIEEPAVKVRQCDVGSAMKSMFNNPEFSDIQFVCKGGIFYGHKAILASRCEQFRAMFTRFRESQQNEIQIHEIDYDIFCTVLEWLYTGSTHIHRKNAVDVLVAADMYSMRELKERCESFLWHYIELDNVIELYQISSTHHAEQLERVCAQFISRNGGKLTMMECFKNLSKEMQDEVCGIVKNKGMLKTDASGMRVLHPLCSAASSSGGEEKQQGEDELMMEQIEVPV